MRYYLVSDNIDTLAGLRMVGVDGVVVHQQGEVRAVLQKAMADPDVGLVLVTSKLFSENSALIFDYKMHQRQPLIIEMPDRHSGGNVAEAIKRYIEEVVGITI